MFVEITSSGAKEQRERLTSVTKALIGAVGLSVREGETLVASEPETATRRSRTPAAVVCERYHVPGPKTY